MAATVSLIPNLKLLNHRNYKYWSFRVKVYLLAEDVWDVVEKTTEPPKPEDDEVAFRSWRKNNAKALLAIQTCCGDDTYPIIEGISKAKAAWDALAEELKPSHSEEDIHIQQPQPAPINSDVCVNFEELEDNKRNQRDRISSGSLYANLNHIQGAALQMQRELQWFKAVESIVPPQAIETINYTEKITARELFTKNHKELVKEGEESMKGTATSCTVVGALIVTIMFAASFTVPGGSNQDTGFPILSRKKLFKVFIISDSISLFSSTTSVMIFLGILTSRYAEDDFLRSLPTKMLLGLFTLFLSIATMMIAFSSTLFIMLEGESWVSIPIILLASVPIASFVWMQFPLFLDIFMFTYGRGIFDKKCRAWE